MYVFDPKLSIKESIIFCFIELMDYFIFEWNMLNIYLNLKLKYNWNIF